MRISVLGTGMVGRVLAGRLTGLTHDVVIGTRDPAATLARAEPDVHGTEPFATWQEQTGVPPVSFEEAGTHAELLINATNGAGSLDALDAAGVASRAGLVVLDVANPLRFEPASPLPTLTVTGADSLGERIQRAFPATRVVKALNTMNCRVMVDPSRIAGGHTVFVAGDDADAKATVVALLGEFGWPENDVLDLGGLVAARGTEMYLPLWVALMRATGTTDVNVAVVR